MYLLKKIFNPEIFQGRNKKKNYFEGWYYKIIDKRTENVFAIIPGVSLDRGKREPHAFIQVLDAHKGKVNYLRYEFSAFKFNENKFEIEIAGNYFSDKEIRLNIDNKDLRVRGHLLFKNIVSYPKTILRPGIMGPYAFVPFMECYHGIVNIHHSIFGQLDILGNKVDFDNGYGYIEKDWGRSFPEAWIWLQSNHFNTDDVSLMFSTAKIPWLGRYFTGFLSFIRIKEKMYLFATYTMAKIIRLNYLENRLKIVIEDRKLRLEIEAVHSGGGVLKAPKNGLMEREVLESITALVRVKLTNRKGNTIYEGEGTNTGLEIVNDIFKYYEGKRGQ